jgi:hypothetical protein
MAERRVKVWYDQEGDYLEVMFEDRPGYFRETANEHVMEKVDNDGNVIGFSVLRVSASKDHPLDVAL